jgi:sugar phosphate isomerase/epimerase
MKLACQEHLLLGDTLVQKWESAQAAGFDGIELRGHGNFAFRERLPEIREARSAGVVMPSVCVIMDHFIGDFDASRRADAVEQMKSLLSVIAEAGGYGAVTPASYGMFSRNLPPFTPPRTPAEDREVLLEGLQALGQHAASAGVLVLLEPLNRYEDHMLHTLAEAVDLCQAVAAPTVKVMADFFHMNIEEDDIAASILAAGQYVAHVHLADSNRLQPGLGHTDFKPGFAALKQIGFTGSMALECRVRGEQQQALKESVRFLRGQM